MNKVENKPVEDIYEPIVLYQGMTFNKSKNLKMAWIKIEGVEYVVKEEDEVGGVIFSKIYKDKITAIVNGKKKTIYLQLK